MRKVCSRCLENKPLKAFRKDRRYRLGVTGWCRDCKNARSRELAREITALPKLPTPAKICTRCQTEKPITEFSKHAARRDGFKSRCKSCIAEMEQVRRMTSDAPKMNHLWSHYRIRLADFKAMLEAQEGRCAICAVPMPKPIVDHCHETGRVRGLLCYRCNTRLFVLEHPDWSAKASAYLKRFH